MYTAPKRPAPCSAPHAPDALCRPGPRWPACCAASNWYAARTCRLFDPAGPRKLYVDVAAQGATQGFTPSLSSCACVAFVGPRRRGGARRVAARPAGGRGAGRPLGTGWCAKCVAGPPRAGRAHKCLDNKARGAGLGGVSKRRVRSERPGRRLGACTCAPGRGGRLWGGRRAGGAASSPPGRTARGGRRAPRGRAPERHQGALCARVIGTKGTTGLPQHGGETLAARRGRRGLLLGGRKGTKGCRRRVCL